MLCASRAPARCWVRPSSRRSGISKSRSHFAPFFPAFFFRSTHAGQVKEVEKGQECGLGLDVKFEVLPDDIMEAVVHGSRLHTIEEVWGDGR